ncbi:Caleosin-domain-containing protein [Lenzites betulinus]|nr:Caleosin-domain-containing protein [Lenzites betulinus]
MATEAQRQNVVVQTAVPEVRVTMTRPPFNPVPAQRKHLPNAGTARANRAPTTSTPEGTPEWAAEHAHQTVLQQHCAFFDADGDGIIWPLDTFRAFRALGFGLFLSALSMLIIHLNFSYPTCPSILPDPFFRLFVENIHKAKHGSDTGTYDNEGRFVPQKFEDFFNKYSNGKDGLTKTDLWEALKGQRVIMDPIGWGGAAFEWTATYLLLWPEDGVLKREDVRRVYDGSIFHEIAMKRARTRKTKAA